MPAKSEETCRAERKLSVNKKNTNKKIKAKLDVDFRSLGTSFRQKAIFNTIIHYNGSGKSKKTSSKFIIDAYAAYKQHIKPEALAALEEIYKSEYLIKNYNIHNKDDFYNLVLKEFKYTDKLKDPYKRIIVIDLDSPNTTPFYKEFVEETRMKDRALKLSNYVYQNVILEKNDIYLGYIARKQLSEMKEIFESKADGSNSLLEDLAKSTLILGSLSKYDIESIMKETVHVKGLSSYSFAQDAHPGTTRTNEIRRLSGKTDTRLR